MKQKLTHENLYEQIEVSQTYGVLTNKVKSFAKDLIDKYANTRMYVDYPCQPEMREAAYDKLMELVFEKDTIKSKDILKYFLHAVNYTFRQVIREQEYAYPEDINSHFPEPTPESKKAAADILTEIRKRRKPTPEKTGMEINKKNLQDLANLLAMVDRNNKLFRDEATVVLTPELERIMKYKEKLPLPLRKITDDLDEMEVDAMVIHSKVAYDERGVGTDVELTLTVRITDIYNERRPNDVEKFDNSMKVL